MSASWLQNEASELDPTPRDQQKITGPGLSIISTAYKIGPALNPLLWRAPILCFLLPHFFFHPPLICDPSLTCMIFFQLPFLHLAVPLIILILSRAPSSLHTYDPDSVYFPLPTPLCSCQGITRSAAALHRSSDWTIARLTPIKQDPCQGHPVFLTPFKMSFWIVASTICCSALFYIPPLVSPLPCIKHKVYPYLTQYPCLDNETAALPLFCKRCQF